MSRKKLHFYHAKLVRDWLQDALVKANAIKEAEKELITTLKIIDEHRFYVRIGYRSLRTFIIHDLKISHTQAQRLTTLVRRTQTTSYIGQRPIPHVSGGRPTPPPPPKENPW